MRRRSCRLPAGLGRAAADRSSAEPSSSRGRSLPDTEEGRVKEHTVARASGSVGEHRDFMCL